MAKVVWTEPALSDLDAIADYIALDNPRAARELVQRVFAHVDQLAAHPRGSKPPELRGWRYRQIIEPPCRVFYREDHAAELANLKSHFATSSWGGRRKPPFVFTEHGAIMVATVLNSARAVEMRVYVVRAFVRFRAALASHASLARKLGALERSLMHASEQTQRQFREVYESIRLLQPRTGERRRPIGFVQHPAEDD